PRDARKESKKWSSGSLDPAGRQGHNAPERSNHGSREKGELARWLKLGSLGRHGSLGSPRKCRTLLWWSDTRCMHGFFPETRSKTVRQQENSAKRKRKKGRSCSVARLLDRDHLVTGESEGRERPLEHVGTTRQSRGKVGHV
ncbi:hypothetical protein CRG98_039950, partial [Punica granatum]